MGVLFAGVMIVGLLILIGSLRLRGCFSFLFWCLAGAFVVWVVLLFASGVLRA